MEFSCIYCSQNIPMISLTSRRFVLICRHTVQSSFFTRKIWPYMSRDLRITVAVAISVLCYMALVSLFLFLLHFHHKLSYNFSTLNSSKDIFKSFMVKLHRDPTKYSLTEYHCDEIHCKVWIFLKIHIGWEGQYISGTDRRKVRFLCFKK